ncbi:hypothetical protein [Rhizobium leguminosarum]|uniref:hypothetical protein n=1 Tax=Rhizobium leguminosarum TaxID=384 RepID=UPI001953FE5D|nr:hypothetical protein [Rhizobium leguminosarum]
MSQAAIFSVPTVGPVSPTTMAARIDDNFKAAVSGHSGSSRPAYAVDGSFWVSTATPGQRKLYAFDGSDDNLVLTLDIATGKITFSDGTHDDAIAAALSDSAFLAAMKWRSRAIGEVVLLNTAITGADIPPSTTSDTVWVELTSGLTGVGAFNNGKLTTESVSGSAPLVSASAVINYGSSPLIGQTIRLLNTEGRIQRPSTSPGALQNDALQDHSHTVRFSDMSGSVGGSDVARFNNANNVLSGASGGNVNSFVNSRVDVETRMKNIGVKAYMRIA